MTRTELLRAITAVKSKFPAQYGVLSENPADYEVLLVGVLNEIYYPAGSEGRLGSAIRNLKVWEKY